MISNITNYNHFIFEDYPVCHRDARERVSRVILTEGLDHLPFYNNEQDKLYGTRVAEYQDDLPKWSGHKNHSSLM